MTTHSYIAILKKEREMYVSLCPEFDVASQAHPSRKQPPISSRQWNCFLNALTKKRSSGAYIPKYS